MDDGKFKNTYFYIENMDLKTDSTSVDLCFNEQSILSETSNQDMDLGMNDSEIRDDSPSDFNNDIVSFNLSKNNDQS
jgi:hypothetical protein